MHHISIYKEVGFILGEIKAKQYDEATISFSITYNCIHLVSSKDQR